MTIGSPALVPFVSTVPSSGAFVLPSISVGAAVVGDEVGDGLFPDGPLPEDVTGDLVGGEVSELPLLPLLPLFTGDLVGGEVSELPLLPLLPLFTGDFVGGEVSELPLLPLLPPLLPHVNVATPFGCV